MSISYGKGKKGTAGRLHAKIIRSLGSCEHCGSSTNLQCAHILSRRFVATYTSLRNAFCLCASCHRFFTDHPVKFGDFVRSTWANEYYEDIHKAAHKGAKTSDEFWEERIFFLKDIEARMQEGELNIVEAREYDND